MTTENMPRRITSDTLEVYRDTRGVRGEDVIEGFEQAIERYVTEHDHYESLTPKKSENKKGCRLSAENIDGREILMVSAMRDGKRIGNIDPNKSYESVELCHPYHKEDFKTRRGQEQFRDPAQLKEVGKYFAEALQTLAS